MMFNNWGALYRHNQQKHIEGPPSYLCDLCGFKSKNKHGMGNHMRKHNEDYREICDRCSKSVCELKYHNFRIHKISETGCYHCKLCDYCYLLGTQFSQHIAVCKGPTEKKHKVDLFSVRIPRKELDPSCRIKTFNKP